MECTLAWLPSLVQRLHFPHLTIYELRGSLEISDDGLDYSSVSQMGVRAPLGVR